MATAEIVAAVDKGIAYLDEVRPGWRERVSVAALDMGDGNRCIAGQAFDGTVVDGCHRPRIETNLRSLTHSCAVAVVPVDTVADGCAAAAINEHAAAVGAGDIPGNGRVYQCHIGEALRGQSAPQRS